jgi:hypothetical protein
VDATSVAGSLRAAVASALQDIESSGFRTVFWYGATSTPSANGIAASVRHDSGCAIGIVAHVRSNTDAQTSFSAISRLADGGLLATGNARVAFRSPREIRVQQLTGLTAREVAKAHLSRLGGIRIRTLDVDDVEATIVELQQRIHANLVRRGIYVPVGSSLSDNE